MVMREEYEGGQAEELLMPTNFFTSIKPDSFYVINFIVLLEI